jgi:hypothetical protein
MSPIDLLKEYLIDQEIGGPQFLALRAIEATAKIPTRARAASNSGFVAVAVVDLAALVCLGPGVVPVAFLAVLAALEPGML